MHSFDLAFRNTNMLIRVLLMMILATSCAYADESAVRDRLLKKHPQLGQVDQVNKSPITGLYEVVTPEHVLYTDESGDYIISGNIWDLRTMRNITEERERALFSVDFDRLPFDLAMKEIKGNGKRKMFIFTDPNCFYCKRLEHELQQVSNVTIYRLMYPIFPGSDQKVHAVWCTKNKTRTWEKMMLQGTLPAKPSSPKCKYPIARAMEWGKKMRVNGTPALVFSNGVLVPGALPAAEIDKALNGETPKR